MFRWLRWLFSSRLYDATFLKESVEYNGVHYVLMELSTAERIAFSRYLAENKESYLLIFAWLVSRSCKQFYKVRPSDLTVKMSPKCLEFLGNEVMRLCGLLPSSVDDAEKKSESAQKSNLSVN